MRILVAGANGYLGGRVSEYLAAQGNEIVALVHHRPTEVNEWLNKMSRVVEGDARDKDVLLSAMEGKVDCVVFTISLDHRMSGKEPFTTLAINVGILWTLLEIYAEKGGGRLIYLSTQQVYGKQNAGEVIREEGPLLPANPYGLTHKYCEDLCSFYSQERGLNCISLRLSNSFGAPVFPTCNCWWLVINDFCKTALEQGRLRLLSDGSSQRDFIPISDICRVIEMVVTLPVSALLHGQYNLSGGKTYTILELAHEVANICADRYGKKFPVVLPDGKVSHDARHHHDISRFTYDISRLRELGFAPSCDLRCGIEEVLDFLVKSSYPAIYTHASTGK
ncbi:NAD-dependent epimerase/dehydratase family protein [Chloroflexota bacterium]